MSFQSNETIIVATLAPDIETPAYARKLLRKYRNNDLGKNIALDYFWENGSFELDALFGLVGLPWRMGASTDFTTVVIRAAEVTGALAECERVLDDLDALAAAILEAVDGEDDEAAELRAFLDDETALTEPMDADTEARRVAQVFAAVVRTLQRAVKRGRGIILVSEVRGIE